MDINSLLFSGNTLSRSLLGSESNAVILCDFAGKILDISPCAIKIAGAEGDNVIGKNVIDFIEPQQRVKARTDFRKILFTKSETSLEYMLLRPDKRIVETEINVTVLRDKEEKPKALFAIMKDITERKQELQRTRALYKISEAAHFTVDFKNFAGRLHSVLNEVIPAKNLFIALYDEERELLNLPYFVDEFDSQEKIVEIKDRSPRKGLTEYILGTGEITLLSKEEIEKMGREGYIELIGTVPFQWLGIPLKTVERKTFGVLAVQSYTPDQTYRDSDMEFFTFISNQLGLVIERKAAEEERAESEQQLQAIFNDSGVGILIVDERGNIIRSNPTIQSMLEYGDKELLTLSYKDITHPDDFARSRENFQRIVNGKTETYRIEKRYLRKNGSIFWAFLTVSSIITSSRQKYYIAVIEDITVKKEYEKVLSRQKTILNGIAEASKALLVDRNFDNAINSALRSIGESSNVSRVYIFKNQTNTDTGKIYMKQLFEWVAEDVTTQIDNELLQELYYDDFSPEWYKILSSGKEVNCVAGNFPGNLVESFKEQEIESLLLVPIFVEDTFWGFIGFDDCKDKYEWTREEISILSIAASSIGGAIERLSILEKINENERKFRLLSENSRDIISLHKPDMSVTYISPGVKLVLGYNPEVLVGRNPLEIMHPDDMAAITKRRSENTEFSGDFIKGEYRLKTVTGKYRWIESIINFLRDESGNVTGMQATSRDVDDRHKAEESLRSSETRFRTIWEKSMDGMRLLDEDGIVIMANEAYCKLVRKSRSEIIGSYYSDIFLDNLQDKNLNHYREKVRNNRIDNFFEDSINLWDGAKKWFEVSNSLIHLESRGKMVLSIFRDITERKENEQRIKNYAAELETTNRNKDRLFSIISHDLKSPFNSLLGYSEILSSDAYFLDQDEIKEVGRSLNSSAKNLYSLLENLLQWSRIQTDRLEFNPAEINVCAIMKKVKGLFFEMAASKNIKIKLAKNKDCAAYTDENFVYTIVRNLTSNAIKFTPTGGKVIIGLEHEGEYLKISVKDSGVGMDKEELAEILTAGKSYTQKGTNAESGTGLGLYLCRELLEKSGSTLEVESKPGHGSTFSFRIPAVKEKKTKNN